MMQKLLKFVLMCCSIVAIGTLASLFFVKKQAYAFDLNVLEKKENLVPILIIGSGCAGYSAALYGARGNVKTVVVVGSQPGGQLSTTTKVENMPGLIDQLGPDIVHNVQKQCEHFGAEILYDSVKSITVSDRIFEVVTEGGLTIHALTIIIATGALPVKLGVSGEEQWWGQGVTTCAICDAPFHKGKDVVVIGGGDSAIEEALQLAAYAKTVTIVVRKDAMRAAPSMQDRLKSVDTINVLYNSEIKAIHGIDDSGVTSVEIYNNKTNSVATKSVSGVFLAIGHKPNSGLVKGLVKVDNEGYIVTHGKTQETTFPGIFAAGDVEDKQYRQAGVAAGSGIRAGLDALNYLQTVGFTSSVAKNLESHYLNLKSPKKIAKAALVDIGSTQAFDTLIQEKPVVVVDIYTTFCPSCKYLLPTLESVAQQLGDTVTFVKINADEVPELAQRYKISSVPSLFLFKKGELLDQTVGALPEDELLAFIQQAL